MKPHDEIKRFGLADGSTVRERLLALAEHGNKPFSCSLHPGVDNVLGLRVPDLRRLAQEIARNDYEAFLESHDIYYMEEKMLHGMVLGCIPVGDCETYLRQVARFVAEINSWSVCDTFAFSGKDRFVGKNVDAVRRFLLGYIESDEEYEVRFAVVMLMTHYLTPESWRATVDVYERISHSGYYVKMAVAWALSVAYVRYPDEMAKRIEAGSFDSATLRMALRKILDSRRVSAAAKEAARRVVKLRLAN